MILLQLRVSHVIQLRFSTCYELIILDTGSIAAFEVDLELWPGEECYEFGVS